MHSARHLALSAVILGITVTGCTSDDQASHARSEGPCESRLCQTYEDGFEVGEKALQSQEEVTLSPAERDSLPVNDGSGDSAVAADAAVAKILCDERAEEYAENLVSVENSEDYQEAFMEGCVDGATPLLSGKPNRYKYEG